ncbi:MAG: K+/H+ antiporter subunit F [Rubrivivax sp.]
MIDAVLPWVISGFGLALLLNAWRLFQGPSLPDRILALDTLYINALALLVCLGMLWRTAVYFEVAMLIGLLGFIGTVVLSKYLLRGDVVE